MATRKSITEGEADTEVAEGGDAAASEGASNEIAAEEAVAEPATTAVDEEQLADKPAETNEADAEDETTLGDKPDLSLDEDDPADRVDTGNGEVVGNGEVQTFVSDDKEVIGGDGVTGKSNDGETYASPDGATGADTHSGGLGIGTTPVAPKAQTADALVSSIAPPAKVEAAVIEVLEHFVSNDKTPVAGSNLFDDLGMARADLPALASRLNAEFGTALTVGEAQNFLLVKDVQNMMKRKLAVAAAIAQ